MKILTSSLITRLPIFLAAMVLLLLVAGCTAGPNEMANVSPEGGAVAGFWLGLWHGAICFFTFIISLFNKNIGIYEIHNSGGWYNFGFIIGVSIAFGGGGSGASRRCRTVIVER